jgi:hypothetical protein
VLVSQICIHLDFTINNTLPLSSHHKDCGTWLPLFWPVRGQAVPTPRALAGCGKRPFWGTTGQWTQRHHSGNVACSSWCENNRWSHATVTQQELPRTGRLHCVQRVTDSSAWYQNVLRVWYHTSYNFVTYQNNIISSLILHNVTHIHFCMVCNEN